MTIKDLPAEDRPYEKLMRLGGEALTDAELIAIILKSGTKTERVVEMAQRLISTSGGLTSLLKKPIAELTQMKGIGEIKAIQLKAVLELSKRISKQNAKQNVEISSPAQIASYFMEEMRHLEREVLKIAMLNAGLRLIKQVDVTMGIQQSVPVDISHILREALLSGAVCIVLVHNHPSGDPAPSKDDIEITAAVKKAAALVNIELTDHIIIGDNCYTSFQESGLM